MKTTSEPVDTILDEIHETRRRLLQQHGGIHGLASFLRAEEAKGEREIRTPDATSEPEQGKRQSRGPVG